MKRRLLFTEAASRITVLLAASAVPMAATAVPSATSIDGPFSLAANANIYNATTVPHMTFTGTLATNDGVAWYSFSGVAGAAVYFDHDAGTSDTLQDSVFGLFRSSGELIAWQDDSFPCCDPGSSSADDAFMGVIVLPANDTYFLSVSSFQHHPIDWQCTQYPLYRPIDNGDGGAGTTNCPNWNFGFFGSGYSAGTFTVHFSNSAPASVPETTTLALLGVGLAGLAASRRRKQ